MTWNESALVQADSVVPISQVKKHDKIILNITELQVKLFAYLDF